MTTRLKLAACIALSGVSAAAAAAGTDAEQAQAADRLAARAQDALDAVLGSGKSRVEIDVAGERSESNSDTERLLPIVQSPAPKPRPLDLPGYAKGKPEPALQSFQKNHEASRRDAGFQIRAIHATIILDEALEAQAAGEVSRLLPPLLRLDASRGDTLVLLRARMRPAWKSAFSTPGDWRRAAYASCAGLVALLSALILGAGLVGAARALGGGRGRDVLSMRAEPAQAEPAPKEPGSIEAGVPAAAPVLGRRFDFLLGCDFELAARAVAAEKPEELSLFFGHLAESIPDLAARLLTRLSLGVQAEVARSLLKLDVADPERLGAIESRLRRAVENGVRGHQSLGRMLSRVNDEARSDLLGRLAVRDAAEVERHVFAFEDVAGLGSASLRRLLGAAPYEVWGPALRGAPRALIEAVLRDLPEGPRAAVRAAAGAPQTREKIEEARSQILDALAELEAKGEWTRGRAGAGEDPV